MCIELTRVYTKCKNADGTDTKHVLGNIIQCSTPPRVPSDEEWKNFEAWRYPEQGESDPNQEPKVDPPPCLLALDKRVEYLNIGCPNCVGNDPAMIPCSGDVLGEVVNVPFRAGFYIKEEDRNSPVVLSKLEEKTAKQMVIDHHREIDVLQAYHYDLGKLILAELTEMSISQDMSPLENAREDEMIHHARMMINHCLPEVAPEMIGIGHRPNADPNLFNIATAIRRLKARPLVEKYSVLLDHNLSHPDDRHRQLTLEYNKHLDQLKHALNPINYKWRVKLAEQLYSHYVAPIAVEHLPGDTTQISVSPSTDRLKILRDAVKAKVISYTIQAMDAMDNHPPHLLTAAVPKEAAIAVLEHIAFILSEDVGLNMSRATAILEMFSPILASAANGAREAEMSDWHNADANKDINNFIGNHLDSVWPRRAPAVPYTWARDAEPVRTKMIKEWLAWFSFDGMAARLTEMVVHDVTADDVARAPDCVYCDLPLGRGFNHCHLPVGVRSCRNGILDDADKHFYGRRCVHVHSRCEMMNGRQVFCVWCRRLFWDE